MNKGGREELTKLILTEASCRGRTSIFNSTGFCKSDLSVFHQQQRCLALAWALHHQKIVTDQSIVAVVGGSFSGIVVASALTLMCQCVVYLFEQENRLLSLHQGSAFRYINPNVNSQPLFKHFDPTYETPWDPFPLFQWRADYAAGVAHQFLTEFGRIRRHRPIILCTSSEVLEITEAKGSRPRKVNLKFSVRKNPVSRRSIAADIAILATGFGKEKNPFGISDFTYWYSGYPTRYLPEKKVETVLISGLGDSGVVEILHYALNHFLHEKIVHLFPGVSGFALTLQQALEQANYWQILYNAESASHDAPCISEISWYLRKKFHELQNDLIREEAREIFLAIESKLRKLAKGRHVNFKHYGSIETFCNALAASDQNRIKESIKATISELASREISAIMGNYIFRKVFPGDFSAIINRKFKVYANGTTSTPYNESLSPFNIVVVWLLQKISAFTYIPGRIKSAKRVDAGYEVQFCDRTFHCDRFATRYGIDFVDTFSSRNFRPAAWNERERFRSYMLARPETSSPPNEDGISKRISLIDETMHAGLHDIHQQEMQLLSRYGPDPEVQRLGSNVLQSFARNKPAEFHRYWLKYCQQHASPRYLDFIGWLSKKIADNSNGKMRTEG